MQGSTVEYTVVFLGLKLIVAGQAHAISRVESLENLIGELEYTKLTGKRPFNNYKLN